MKLLLDTHIWLWSLLEPSRLNDRVTAELTSPDNELWLSPISTWELLILTEKGRVVLDCDVDSWIASAREAAPMLEAPVTHNVAVESRRISLVHQDPADRFLAATAKVFELTLVTEDDRLLAGQGYAVLSNR